MTEAHGALSAWESFYVIVGSSGAALTGLQFVVIALVADSDARAGHREIATFGTPTIIHFAAVLLMAAVLTAPWPTLQSVAIALGLAGAVGVAYTIITTLRARRVELYTPVLEDWIWHVVLPFVAYGTLGLSAILLPRFEMVPLFAIGACALLLLFIGIHNAWDTVTYIALDMPTQRREEQPPTPAPAPNSSPDAANRPFTPGDGP